jgi:aconitate hydratase
VIKGPNIKSLPEFNPLEENLSCKTVLKTVDNITTDHILPAGSKVLPFRSNLPKISEFTFGAVDKDFVSRAKEAGNGIIIGGENFGQGSSREHAALAPRFLGIRIILSKSFARIYLANIINFGIIPLTFENPADYDLINLGDEIVFNGIKETIKTGAPLFAQVSGREIKVKYDLTSRQKELIFAGGLLKWIKTSK